MDARFGEMLDTSLEERACKVSAPGRAARELARAGIQQLRPQATADEVEVELVGRLYGRDVADSLSRHLTGRRG